MDSLAVNLIFFLSKFFWIEVGLLEASNPELELLLRTPNLQSSESLAVGDEPVTSDELLLNWSFICYFNESNFSFYRSGLGGGGRGGG